MCDIHFTDWSTEYSYALSNGYDDLIDLLVEGFSQTHYDDASEKKRVANNMLFATLKYHSNSKENKELDQYLPSYEIKAKPSSTAIVDTLLSHGANLNESTPFYSFETPLYELLYHSESDKFSADLLKHLLNAKSLDQNGEFSISTKVDKHCIIMALALHSSDKEDLCKLLIQRASEEERLNAVYALSPNQYKWLCFLLPELSNPNNLLFDAIAQKNSSLITHLLSEENQSCFDINKRDEQNYTPLMLALRTYPGQGEKEGNPDETIVDQLLGVPGIDWSLSMPQDEDRPYKGWTALEFAVEAGFMESAQTIWAAQKAEKRFCTTNYSPINEKDNQSQPPKSYNQKALLDLCAYLTAGAKRERNDRFWAGLFAPFGGYNAGEKQDAGIALLDVALGLKDLDSLYKSEALIGPITQGRLGKIFARLVDEDLRNEAEAHVKSTPSY